MTTKASHLLTQTARRKYPLFILLFIFLIIIYPFTSTFLPGLSALESQYSPADPLSAHPPLPPSSESLSATEIPASTLLARPISNDRTTIPKIIHQTWFPAGTNMSASAKEWVNTIKRFHPEWEYVLWDDESNEELVRRYFPWFLETYRSLPKEINRADMARNFYMFLFGGMYADVDTESLRPVDSLFVAHDVALNSHEAILSSFSPPAAKMQRAFMGRMAHTLDPEGLGAIPNGWMASPPGHPFFLLPVLAVQANPTGDGSVEGMTGPDRNWIFWSNLTILFNKWILESTPFPILLTTWHLLFATLATQLLARTTPLLSSRKTINMTPKLYITRIAPIGVLYSGSLVCSNMAYLYLNVGFIQMLKASGPVITLLTSALYGVTTLTAPKTLNVLFITASVALTVSSEIQFSWVGVALQGVALMFDANRLVLLQLITAGSSSNAPDSGSESESARGRGGDEESGLVRDENGEEAQEAEKDRHHHQEGEEGPSLDSEMGMKDKANSSSNKGIPKMDPLLSLYYSAPICALMNAILAWKGEIEPFLYSSSQPQPQPQSQVQPQYQSEPGSLLQIILNTGLGILLLNACVGFMLNVAVFTLIGKTSGLTMTLVSIPKNILLILASVVLWGTRVSALQWVGYAGALAGLVVYSGGGGFVCGLFAGVVKKVGLGGRKGRGRYERVLQAKEGLV
ncbi:hypothetical protein BJY04DRAFT_206027 [Aspergillus karnatakaensis]|uniref:uncharacterized protein n=1 Tax=Aspergillus karnatakaensis TaxID=1810916 RepID=UPI003CCCA3FB